MPSKFEVQSEGEHKTLAPLFIVVTFKYPSMNNRVYMREPSFRSCYLLTYLVFRDRYIRCQSRSGNASTSCFRGSAFKLELPSHPILP